MSISTTFYRARLLRPDGTVVVRPFFVRNAAEVRSEAAQAGATVLDIRRQRHGAWWQREIYSGEYKREFLRSVSFFVETGIPPTEALLRVMQRESNARKRTEFEPAIEIIRAGGRFAMAVEHTGMFDSAVLLLLRAGELIGIKRVVPAIEGLMQARDQLRKFVATIVSVLGLEVATAVSSAAGIRFAALPYIRKSFAVPERANDAERAAAAVMQAKLDQVSTFTELMLALAIVVFVLVGTGAVAWLASVEWRQRLAHAVLRLPGGKALIFHAQLADGFGVAATLLDSGVTLSTVLVTLADASSRGPVARYWADAAARLRQGLPVAGALGDTQVLTEAEVVALHAHRNVEQLARVCRSIAERRAHAARMARLRFVKFSTLVTVAYISAVVGAAVWMLMVQDEGMGMMMKALG